MRLRQFLKTLKLTGILAGIIVVILVIIHWELIIYGVAQARGQLQIVNNAVPIREMLENPNLDPELREKLQLVQAIRFFAIDSLGLNDSENYTTYYDQQGEPLLWVVTASQPYELRPYEWHFPVIGTVPYKGYFDQGKARELAHELEEKNLDVYVREAGGWSTLGFFKDPILSGMLSRSEGEIASLVIHELTHATVFVKNDIDFNENLATFVGGTGAEVFLRSHYGPESKEYRGYLLEKADTRRFTDQAIRGMDYLDSIYDDMDPGLPVAKKEEVRQKAIREIISSFDTLNYTVPDRYEGIFDESIPNNAWFLSFERYRGQQQIFEKEYREKFNIDLRAYIRYLKEKYRYL